MGNDVASPNDEKSWIASQKYVVKELIRLDGECKENDKMIRENKDKVVSDCKTCREELITKIADLDKKLSALQARIIGAVAVIVIVIEIVVKLINR